MLSPTVALTVEGVYQWERLSYDEGSANVDVNGNSVGIQVGIAAFLF